MILEIPYVYTATVIMPRRQNGKDVGVRASMPVKLAEFAAEQAPLAAVAHVQRYDEDEEAFRLQRFEYFDTPMGLMTPWRPKPNEYDDDFTMLDRVSVAELEGFLRDGGPELFPFLRPKSRDGSYNIEYDTYLRTGDPVREWLGDNRLQVAEKIANAISRCAVVDGALCMATDGPVWVVDSRGFRERGEASVIAETSSAAALAMDRSRTLTNLFRADRLADAVAHAQYLLEVDTKTPDRRPNEPTGTIEVLLPQAFQLDDDWQALKETAASVVGDNMARIGSWPREAGNLFYDLRDTLRTTVQADAPFTVDLLDAMRAFADRVALARLPNVIVGKRDELLHTLARLERGHAPAPEADLPVLGR